MRWLRNRRLLGRERSRGQSLVLLAVLLPVLLIFVAFVVDGAHAFVDYRHDQNAADAASLAGAQEIGSPACTGDQLQCIQDEVTDYAFQNGAWPNDHTAGPLDHSWEIQPCASGGLQGPQGPGGGDVQACFEWPFTGGNPSPDPSRVLVRIRNCTKLFFGFALGAVGINLQPICHSVRSVSISRPITTTTVIPPSTGTLPDLTSVSSSFSTTVVNGSTSTITNLSTTTIPGGTTVIAGGTTVIPGGTTVIPGGTTTIPGSATTSPPSTTAFVSTVALKNGGVAFANSQACPALMLSGNTGSNTGFETNGGVQLGNNSVVDTIVWPQKPNCDVINGHPTVSNAYILSPSPVGWPIPIPTPPSAPPTAPNSCTGPFNLGSSGTVTFTLVAHPTKGVYCMTGSGTIKVAASGDYSGYTFVAPTITITAASSKFSPADGENVVFNSTSNALSISGANETISGMMCLGSADVTMKMSATHPPGAYCLLGTAQLQISDQKQNWTGYSFYGYSVNVAASGSYFCPSTSTGTFDTTAKNDGLSCDNFNLPLFDAYGAPPAPNGSAGLGIRGNGNFAFGEMFAQYGQVTLNGNGIAGGSGYIEGDTILMNGNLSNYLGIGPGEVGGVMVTSTTPGTVGTTPDTTVTNPDTTVTNPDTTVTNPDTTVTNPDTTSTITNISTTVDAGSTSTITSATTTVIPGATTTNPGTTATSTTGTDLALNQ
jgi:hypothetical protein